MGDFSYLGRAALTRAIRIVACADAAFEDGDMDDAKDRLTELLESVFNGGGADGPDDGAVDQLVTVVDALGGDEDQMTFLREGLEEENEGDVPQIKWVDYLQSYALDDIRDILPLALADATID